MDLAAILRSSSGRSVTGTILISWPSSPVIKKPNTGDQSLDAWRTWKRDPRVHADYGSGWLRMYRFIPGENRVVAITFDPRTEELCESTSLVPDRSQHQFEISIRHAGPRGCRPLMLELPLE